MSTKKNSSFGAVFLPRTEGGPVFFNRAGSSSSQVWPDRRSPGNMNANESAENIMKLWDTSTMKRFEVFMDKLWEDKSPWKMEYLQKTAPTWKNQSTAILKCKMELIKRLLTIKVTGPASLEDWILLFLYYENDLDLPHDLMSLIRPRSQATNLRSYVDIVQPRTVLRADYSILPPRQLTNDNIFSNPPMPGYGTERENTPDIYPNAYTGYVNRARDTTYQQRNFRVFPRHVAQTAVPDRDKDPRSRMTVT